MPLNPLDAALLGFLNDLSRFSYTFDILVLIIADATLLKGGMVFALYAWLWMTPSEDRDRNRLVLTGTVAASFAALVVARALALTLPFRPRPLHAQFDWFTVPSGIEKKLEGWSSFPSDHATLFYCLAAGAWLVSRRAGWVSLAWVTGVIMLPRVYLGLHYPTDILAGAVIGFALTWIATRGPVMERLSWALVLERRRPALFYALAFLMMFEMANLFDHVRELGGFGADVAQNVAGRVLK